MTNDDMAKFVDTSDEWIRERTGIRERRIAAQEEALTDIALPAVRARARRGRADASEIDLVIVATVTPDMLFPTASALMADTLGMRNAAAYDLLAGCTGFMYAIAQAYGMLASGLSKKALVVGGDVLSKILDWEDRSTRRALRRRRRRGRAWSRSTTGGFLGFELGADGGGGIHLCYPGSGSRHYEGPKPVAEDERPRGVQVRDARDGLVGRGGARRSAARRSTTSTSTSRTRRTSGSSTTPSASSESRRRRRS